MFCKQIRKIRYYCYIIKKIIKKTENLHMNKKFLDIIHFKENIFEEKNNKDHNGIKFKQ